MRLSAPRMKLDGFTMAHLYLSLLEQHCECQLARTDHHVQAVNVTVPLANVTYLVLSCKGTVLFAAPKACVAQTDDS